MRSYNSLNAVSSPEATEFRSTDSISAIVVAGIVVCPYASGVTQYGLGLLEETATGYNYDAISRSSFWGTQDRLVYFSTLLISRKHRDGSATTAESVFSRS